MSVWMKNLIGAAFVLILVAIAWRIYQGAGGEAKIWEFGVVVHPGRPHDPTGAAGTSTTTTTVVSTSASAVQSCRRPEHGVEFWRRTETWTADSGWRRGGSSPAEFCGAQKLDRERRFPDRRVELLGSDEKHKSEYTPFKHDYYRYTCLFEDRWDPVYREAESPSCED